MLFLNFSGNTRVCAYNDAKLCIEGILGNQSQFYATCSGRVITSVENLQPLSTVSIFPKLKGGKGGFGAKLKTEGGKKVKPNENMFSRDTQGRPIAYSTIQKDFRDFCEKKISQQASVKQQLAQFRVMENTLKQEYTGMKLDRTYHAQMEETQKKLSNSLKVGLQKYLIKKKQQKCEKSEKGEEGDEEKKEKGEEVEKLESGKRERKQGSEVEDEGKPMKRVKPCEEKEEAGQKQQLSCKAEVKPQSAVSSVPKLLSARDKLKSLFKK